MKELVIVSGPTAAGKSSAALELALRTGGEIISADSMQVYRGMDIGTAKLKKEEMKGVPHHMIDILDPGEDFNVALFKENADRLIRQILDRKNVPIMTGGTGFYIRAVLYGAGFNEGETDEGIRERLERTAGEKGISFLEEQLKTEDPPSFEKYRGNLKRIVRALEYKELTGERLSEKNERELNCRPVYDAIHFCLTLPRDVLYERINLRVDRMMEEGLLEEVERLKARGLPADATSMQALGYRQLFDYLDGKVSLEDAVNRIKTETRHFAKRQFTWFKAQKDVIFLDRSSFNSDIEAAERMKEIIDESC